MEKECDCGGETMTIDNKDAHGQTIQVGHKTCGGAIIDREWILTAGDCLWPSDNAADYCVIVGHNNITDLPPKFIVDKLRRQVNWTNCAQPGQIPLQVIRHAKFDAAELRAGDVSYAAKWFIRSHDIGLIKMAPMSFATSDVGRIFLPTEASNNRDHNCSVAGWGFTETRETSNDLKSISSKIWSEPNCRRNVALKDYQLLENPVWENPFYCFGQTRRGNVCDRDTGAPLSCERSDGQFEVVGVLTSIPRDCWGPDFYMDALGNPSLFTRVSPFLKWIKETIEANTED